MQALYKVKDGLVSFGPELFEVFHLLEGRFAKLATSLGATPMTLPALIRVEDLSQIDYFENFPHLGTWVGPIKHACLESYTEGSRIEEVSSDDLVNSRFGLPSAACYGVYIDLRDAALAESRVVTITERCFRNEEHYSDLERLWCFHMREVVCVGGEADVQSFLHRGKDAVRNMIARLDFPVKIEMAQDPFFFNENPRYLMQTLIPTKEEMKYEMKSEMKDLAIASVNSHQNFFGDRLNITGPDGKRAFTGCVAMGLERWIAVLLDRYDGDLTAIRNAVTSWE